MVLILLPGEATYYQIGNFYGYFPEARLSTIAPIIEDMNIKGYVAVHYLMSDLYQSRSGLLWIIQLLYIITYLVAAALFLWYSRYIRRPLREITKGASEFANGNLSYQIPLDSENEMGYLAKNLNYMADKLNRSGEYQRQFISNISHDFRSPLTSIKGYIEAMIDGTIPVEMPGKVLKDHLLRNRASGKAYPRASDSQRTRYSKTYAEHSAF